MTIRPMAPADLPAARILLDQLGYALSPDEVAARFAIVTAASDHAVFVAEADGAVAGLLHVYFRPALDKPPEAVVQALVVDKARRGGGIGRALMAEAERWAAGRGLGSVTLSSHISREAAHAFYRALGYVVASDSLWLRKELG